MSRHPRPWCGNEECPCAGPSLICNSFMDGADQDGKTYCVRCGWEHSDHTTKHLTDSELCAEFWHAWNRTKTGPAHARDWTEYDRTIVIHRFATTPHAGEA